MWWDFAIKKTLDKNRTGHVTFLTCPEQVKKSCIDSCL